VCAKHLFFSIVCDHTTCILTPLLPFPPFPFGALSRTPQLNSTLLPQSLAIKEIPSDGNCLFRAVADQLQYVLTLTHSAHAGADADADARTDETKGLDVNRDHVSLRAMAAQHIRTHREVRACVRVVCCVLRVVCCMLYVIRASCM